MSQDQYDLGVSGGLGSAMGGFEAEQKNKAQEAALESQAATQAAAQRLREQRFGAQQQTAGDFQSTMAKYEAAQDPATKHYLMGHLMGLKPKLAKSLMDMQGEQNHSQRVEAAQTAFKIHSTPAGPQRQNVIQQHYQQAKAAGDTEGMKDYAALSVMPGPLQDHALAVQGSLGLTPYHRAMVNKKSPGITINTGQKAQTAQAIGLAKIGVANLKDVDAKAKMAQGMMQNLNQISSINPQTGAFVPIKAKLENMAISMGKLAGLSPKNQAALNKQMDTATSTQELLHSVTTMLIQKLQTPGTGRKTNMMMQEFGKSLPHVTDTDTARKYKIEQMSAIYDYYIRRKQFYDAQLDKDANTPIRKITEAWNKGEGSLPAITKPGVSNPPVFYYKFRDEYLAKYPNSTSAQLMPQINSAWRSLNKVDRRATV